MNLQKMLQDAQKSPFLRWKLNFLLKFALPFNSPHKFIVSKINNDMVETFAAYSKKNFNHLRGIHACAIATIGELAAGLSLCQHFSGKTYRVIMAKMEVEYHYQAKKDLNAICKLSISDSEAMIARLSEQDKVMQELKSEVYDLDKNHVATVSTHWQVKPWSKTRVQR